MKSQYNGSLLPRGEGQDEGVIEIIVLAFLIPPHPNPLPQGEGVNETAVVAYITLLRTQYWPVGRKGHAVSS